MPKQQIPVTLDEELLVILKAEIATGRFRNRSHAVEYFITKALEQEKEENTNGKY